jgi:hypothetical protein
LNSKRILLYIGVFFSRFPFPCKAQRRLCRGFAAVLGEMNFCALIPLPLEFLKLARPSEERFNHISALPAGFAGCAFDPSLAGIAWNAFMAQPCAKLICGCGFFLSRISPCCGKYRDCKRIRARRRLARALRLSISGSPLNLPLHFPCL